MTEENSLWSGGAVNLPARQEPTEAPQAPAAWRSKNPLLVREGEDVNR